MKWLFLIILTSNIFYLKAQNYQSFNLASESYYINNEDEIFGIRIDSLITNGGDSIYMFHEELNYDFNSPNCQAFPGPTWLGDKVVVNQNNENIFFTLSGDSLLLKTGARLGDKWPFYSFTDTTHYVECEVLAHDTATVLGMLDSIKTISFITKDQNGDTVAHLINGKEITLSKTNGLTQTLNFRDIFSTFADYQAFNLIGTRNPSTGINLDLTRGDVFDFEVGDEFHYKIESYSGPPDYEVRVVQNKELSTGGDSVFYVYERTFYQTSWNSSTIDTNVSVQTGADTHSIYPAFSEGKMPEELFIPDLKYYSVTDGIEFTFHHNYLNNYDDSTNCYDIVLLSGWNWTQRKFSAGVGETYYYHSMGGQQTDTIKTLIYYKKVGGETSGTPLRVKAKTMIRSNEFIIFPNPAKNSVNIKLPGNFSYPELEILDLMGRSLISLPITTDRLSINIQHLAKGVYIIQAGNIRRMFVKKD